MDRGGKLHFLYYSGDPAGSNLYYVKSSMPAARGRLPLHVNREAGSAIAAGTVRGGQVRLGRMAAFTSAGLDLRKPSSRVRHNPESGKVGEPMLYSRSNDSGTAFEPERNLMTRTFGLDGGGIIAADSTG
jgi:hypothetical protein